MTDLIAIRRGADAAARHTSRKIKRNTLKRDAALLLPSEWRGHITLLADAAGRAARGNQVNALQNECAVYTHWIVEYAGARAADLSESAIRTAAQELAKRAVDFGLGDVAGVGVAAAYWRMHRYCERHGVGLDSIDNKTGGRKQFGHVVGSGAWLDALAARVRCKYWWRRKLRRMVALQLERGAIALGLIGAHSGQWYASDKAVKRRAQQVAANAETMKAALVQNESGQAMSLFDVAQRGVGNKTVRRNELMTRIKGCESYADDAGMCGLFLTLTCPSRFHAQLQKGGRNPKHDGSTPADAQAWLTTQWARLRAKLHRRNISIMGFRVAEPHHDGCPHWHCLIWCKPEHAPQVEALTRSQWLSDAGTERGAQENRVKVIAMHKGGATAYVAKYVAKHIDDALINSTHIDDNGEGAGNFTLQADLLGDMEITPSQRVDAWAATWRIRQFQAIGQPPVTVWRELRRMKQDQAAAGNGDLIAAWLAAGNAPRGQKPKACWHSYMKAQGGACQKRVAYRLSCARVFNVSLGRYGQTEQSAIVGIKQQNTLAGFEAVPNLISRKLAWGAEGFASRFERGAVQGATRAGVFQQSGEAALPWTRVNNCTQDLDEREVNNQWNDLFIQSLISEKLRKREMKGLLI